MASNLIAVIAHLILSFLAPSRWNYYCEEFVDEQGICCFAAVREGTNNRSPAP